MDILQVRQLWDYFILLNFTEMHAIPHSLTSHLMSGGDAKTVPNVLGKIIFFVVVVTWANGIEVLYP